MSAAGGSPTFTLSLSAELSIDPETVPLIVLSPNGTNYTLNTGVMDAINYDSIQTTIVYSTQLGASIMLLITILLLTKPEKRFAPIHVLNCISLVLNFLRLLLQTLYFTSPFNGTYVNLTGDFTTVPHSAYNTQVAAVVLQILLVITVEISLAFQVQVVCLELRQRYRRMIFAVSLAVALLAIGFRIAYGIANAQYILALKDPLDIMWLEAANLNATATSIFFFSAVFVIKLGLALWHRHKMGLKRWGPMKIVFTMGCQTLFIPAIFAILQYCPTGIIELDSIVLTLVALFLPLSSIWAASAVDGRPTSDNAFLVGRSATLGEASTLCVSQANSRKS